MTLNASAVAFQTLKYAGVAYLLYLAWQTWRDPTPLEVEQQAAPQSVWQVIRTAVLINLLNPKLTKVCAAPLNPPNGSTTNQTDCNCLRS